MKAMPRTGIQPIGDFVLAETELARLRPTEDTITLGNIGEAAPQAFLSIDSHLPMTPRPADTPLSSSRQVWMRRLDGALCTKEFALSTSTG